MKTIEIDEGVYGVLEKAARGFNETPNDVLRRLLAVRQEPEVNPTSPRSLLREYMESTSFRFWGGNAKKRYLGLMSFLHDRDPKRFAEFDGYRRGRRVHISKSRETIEQSGSSTQPQQIGKTEFFAITNLPNSLKRVIISDLLRAYSFSEEDIDSARRALSDDS